MSDPVNHLKHELLAAADRRQGRAPVRVGRPPRRWRRWAVAVTVPVAGVVALALFWPSGGADVGVLDRARAAVGGGPVIHVVLRGEPLEVYDLDRQEYRSIPVLREEWYDPARDPGFHYEQRVGPHLAGGCLCRIPVRSLEGVDDLAGVATAYRHALATDRASLGLEETVRGQRVYWIRFSHPSPGGIRQYEVAVDAETFEPRFLRLDGGRIATVEVFETLGAGEGDFTIRPGEEDGNWESEGPRSPEQARDALPNALWLGERFGELALSSLREVSTTAANVSGPPEDLRALVLCYGPGDPCAVTITEATRPATGGEEWVIVPGGPAGALWDHARGLADGLGLGYVIRDGVYVTIMARSREELIAVAQALTPIP